MELKKNALKILKLESEHFASLRVNANPELTINVDGDRGARLCYRQMKDIVLFVIVPIPCSRVRQVIHPGRRQATLHQLSGHMRISPFLGM